MSELVQGPVKYETGKIDKKQDALPFYYYVYPGGSTEIMEDYGDYFGVRWTANPVLTAVDTVRLLQRIEGIDPEINGFEFRVNAQAVSMKEWSVDEAARLLTECDDPQTWSYECSAGTYFWDKLSRNNIQVGVLTYNGAPTGPMLAWQQATATPEIITRRNPHIAVHIPPEGSIEQQAEEYTTSGR